MNKSLKYWGSLILTLIVAIAILAGASYLVPEKQLPAEQTYRACAPGKVPTCTRDVRLMCSPDGKEQRQVPSSCSCGLDAKALERQGWQDCPSKFPAELLTKAKELGSVRVIVNLRVQLPENRALQVRAIAQAREALLSELAGTKYRVTREFKTVPAVALEVSAEALWVLERSKLVKRVVENVAVPPAR